PAGRSEEKLGRGLTHGLRILSCHGDRRLDDIGERDVVEADKRDPALEPGAAQRTDAADREEVLACEERRRRVGEREQLADGARGGFGIPEARSGGGAVSLGTGPGGSLWGGGETLLGPRARE